MSYEPKGKIAKLLADMRQAGMDAVWNSTEVAAAMGITPGAVGVYTEAAIRNKALFRELKEGRTRFSLTAFEPKPVDPGSRSVFARETTATGWRPPAMSTPRQIPAEPARTPLPQPLKQQLQPGASVFPPAAAPTPTRPPKPSPPPKPSLPPALVPSLTRNAPAPNAFEQLAQDLGRVDDEPALDLVAAPPITTKPKVDEPLQEPEAEAAPVDFDACVFLDGRMQVWGGEANEDGSRAFTAAQVMQLRTMLAWRLPSAPAA